MKVQVLYAFAADALLVVHVMFVLFVVFGLVLVFVGKYVHWLWVRNLWFRLAHLTGVAVVVVQSWFGLVCPLTIWEMYLRSKSDGVVYEGTFIAHILNDLLYYNAPAWVFVVCYTVFGGLVVFSWFWVRPDFAARLQGSEGNLEK